MVTISKKILLVTGLGHTDLSGKVPRPGVLMLRKALRRSGHDAMVHNYSTSLMQRMFSGNTVAELARIYEQSIKPMVVDGKSPLARFWKIPQLRQDIKRLQEIAQDLSRIEAGVFQEVGQEIAERVAEDGFDAVGFSLYLGSSTTGSITMADILRSNNPNIPILFGGPQTSHFAEAIYRETSSPTALVLGEGELSIIKLAEIIDSLKQGRLNDLSRVPNLVYRAEDGRIISTPRKRLSLKEWVEISAVPYEEGDFEGLMQYAFIEASRGCFYQCRFCPQPILSGINRYLKPGVKIVDEMVELYQRFGISHFELVGSSTPPGQVEDIADELISRNLDDKFSWVLFMRGKDERPKATPIPDLMKKIKAAGASAIFFGVEAADNETLAKMGKKATIEDTKAAMLAAKAAGIAVIGSFIYPYPGMPENEGKLITRFLKETRPLSAPVQALGLLPGTYDAVHAEEIGCEVVYPNKKDQELYLAGKKGKPTMASPEVLSYLLRYPLILSLPMKLWSPLPYKINGMDFKTYVGKVNALQKKIAQLGILLGFSHSHFLLAQAMGIAPSELSERMFYSSLTGDAVETKKLIQRFNLGQK